MNNRLLGTFIILLLFLPAGCARDAKPEASVRLEEPSQAQTQAQARPITAFSKMLADPRLAWSGRADHGNSSEFDPDPELDLAGTTIRDELQSMLMAYAPRIWLHPEEPYYPMDPMDFVRGSSLWFRHNWAANERIASAGQVDARELGLHNTGVYQRGPKFLFWDIGSMLTPANRIPLARPYQSGFLLNGEGYTLRLEDSLLTRILKRFAGQGRAQELERVPIFWRLGKLSPNATEAQKPFPNREVVVLEYWYHVPYSYANRAGIGNHQGDWEGMAMLIEMKVGSNDKLHHRLVATFMASHESGQWRCPSELSWTQETTSPGRPGRWIASADQRIEAFSAKGTHATYSAAGEFKTPWITDRAARGTAWDTWKNVRPLELEPYYGYSGAWGDSNLFSFMTGPLVPGPEFKTLPKHNVLANPLALKRVRRACALKTDLSAGLPES